MRKWLTQLILKYQHSIPSTEINDQKNWIITYLQPGIILWLVTQRSFSTGDCVAYFAASWVNWVLLCHRKHIRIVLSNDKHFGFGANGSMIKWNWKKTRPNSPEYIRKVFHDSMVIPFQYKNVSHRTLTRSTLLTELRKFPSSILSFPA